MNKKMLFIILVIALVACICVGLFMKNNGEKSEKERETNTFSLKYEGVETLPGSKFDENAISKESSLSEIPSCAFDGVDKVYTYSNAEIIVADINGTPTVYSIYFKDDTVSTNEGVKITDSKDKMIKAYGENFKNDIENKYEYTKENVILSFIVENDVITSIEYTLITNN